jgi:hypothetical protein
MERICAWCGKNLGKKKGKAEDITHSICTKCKAEQLKKIKKLEKVA